MGENKYFYVKDIFGARAKWSIIGTGKLTGEKFQYFDDDSCIMVRTLSGHLQIEANDFSPSKNIDFGVVNEFAFTCWPVSNEKIKSDQIVWLGNLRLGELVNGTYSREQLRLLRNTVYAQHGYAFESADRKSIFLNSDGIFPILI